MSAAREIQASRDAEDRARHEERVSWLSVDRPQWSDGSNVSPFDKIDLLRQSNLWLKENANPAAKPADPAEEPNHG